MCPVGLNLSGAHKDRRFRWEVPVSLLQSRRSRHFSRAGGIKAGGWWLYVQKAPTTLRHTGCLPTRPLARGDLAVWPRAAVKAAMAARQTVAGRRLRHGQSSQVRPAVECT